MKWLNELNLVTSIRDFELEKDYILRSKVELFLSATLKSRIHEWLPGKHEGNNFEIAPHSVALDLEWVANNPRHLFGINRPNGSPYQWPAKLPKYLEESIKGTLFFHLRLYCAMNPLPQIIESELGIGRAFGKRDLPLKYDENEWMSAEKYAAKWLEKHFDLPFEVDLSGTSWARSALSLNVSIDDTTKLYPFCENGIACYFVTKMKIEDRWVILPLSAYIHRGENEQMFLHSLPSNSIVFMDDRGAIGTDEVLFTSDLDFAAANTNIPGLRVCSWYGDISKVKFSDEISHRRVYYLLKDTSFRSLQEGLGFLQESRRHGIYVDFIVLKNVSFLDPDFNRGVQEGQFDGADVLVDAEFLELAKQESIAIPSELREEDFCIYSSSQLEKLSPLPFLIWPFLQKGSYAVCFAPTGVGKTWIGLSLGLALCSQKNVFGELYPTDGKHHKVLYLSGEMDVNTFGDRIKKLNKHYNPESTPNKNNFCLIQKSTLNLCTESDQQWVERALEQCKEKYGMPGLPVDFIIIDNLATLTREGELPSNWDKVFLWMSSLMKRGMTFLIIHHCSAEPKMRGSTRIGDKAAVLLHVQDSTGSNDLLRLNLSFEKTRPGKKSDFQPVRVEIDLETPENGWRSVPLSNSEAGVKIKILCTQSSTGPITTKPKKKKTALSKSWQALNDEERAQEIVYGFNRGDSSAQMAVNLGVSLATIEKFRSKNNLRVRDLNDTEKKD